MATPGPCREGIHHLLRFATVIGERSVVAAEDVYARASYRSGITAASEPMTEAG